MDQVRLDGCGVLLLEDEALVLLDLQTTLEGVGARVHGAMTVRHARDLLNTETISAAVLDYAVADGNCADLCGLLSAEQIPFALYSGHSELDEDCEQGEIIFKPAGADEVVAVVVKMLSARK